MFFLQLIDMFTLLSIQTVRFLQTEVTWHRIITVANEEFFVCLLATLRLELSDPDST